ncbi:type II toxin-antitoxin system ParD family antitoxin [Marinomonas colpomeniae]|uniref:type II toxin-antitoxin system ParD family antitoxin n=1 Tax=Marinomonas colpomeniae TaxID=2774408 RepID=UPI0019D5F300|nr:type II toxin-antitoxin system ParD family antitoxin [Marinomonas colpomeniae]
MHTVLRKLEDKESKLKTLRSLIKEGRVSGTVKYSYDDLMKELDDQLAKQKNSGLK